MIKLLQNENMKIYVRLRTWILIGIVALAVVLVAVVLHSHQHVNPHWKQDLATQTTAMEQRVQQSKHLPASAIAAIKQQITVNRYDLQHNIDPTRYHAWSFAAVAQNLSSLLIAFIAVVAGDIVAGEFSGGTIKMLLTQTATRSRILASKYLAALLFALFLTAFMLVFSVFVGGMFFGFSGASAPQVYADTTSGVAQMPVMNFLLMRYGFLAIQVIVTTTIAFMVSTIFRSSALAITTSILAFLVGTTLVNALSSYHWVRYILFANTDLSQFVIGGPVIHGLTLGFSLTMLIAYFIVMMGLSWWVFLKRDVASN